MPTWSSSRTSIAMCCSAERPRRSNIDWSVRTRCSRLSACTRPSADCEPGVERDAGVARQVACRLAGRRPSARNSSSITELHTSSSTKPVQPESVASSLRYSSASRPTTPALRRSGRSLVTTTTSRPSRPRLQRDGEDAVVVGVGASAAAAAPSSSWWFSSTRSVPPSSLTGMGSSSEPWRVRSSSRKRRLWRAAQPSSGWCRLPSSSVRTTSGSTTSCSAKRVTASGSARRTEVSTT